MSVIDRSELQSTVLPGPQAAPQRDGAFCIAWEVPARAMLDARVSDWLRERLGSDYARADARVRWRVSAHEPCELWVDAGQHALRVAAIAPATMDTWREDGRTLTCAAAGERLRVTLVHEQAGPRLLYAQMLWADLGVEGGRYDVASLVA